MTDYREPHPSNPDQLMARMVGVCWHSPTSDRWPCGGSIRQVVSFEEMSGYHPGVDAGTIYEWIAFCGCGHQEYQHGAGAGLVDCLVCSCESYVKKFEETEE